jgi:phosphatidylglycerol:prolipoprotein diacylglycerol transferase
MTVQAITGEVESAHRSMARPLGRTEPGGIVGATTSALDWLGERVVMFRYRDWVVVSFGVFATVGAWLTMILMGFLLVGQGLSLGQFSSLALLCCAAVVAGSWLLAQALDLRASATDRGAVLRRPTFVSWGGILALALALLLFGMFSEQGVLILLDAAARSALLGHVVGRLGCLSYGCCFGRPTHSPLAITYRDPRAKAVRVGHRHGVPLHPTPLYEALFGLGLFAAVNALALAGAPLGAPTALAFFGYGCGRFAIEFLRDNDGRMVTDHIALNHLIALAFVLLGATFAGALLLGEPGVAPPFALAASLRDVPWISAATLPGALMVFVGFSLHRGEVGRW